MNKSNRNKSKRQPESSVTVVFRFLPCVACKQVQDRFVVFSSRSQELEPVKIINVLMILYNANDIFIMIFVE